MRPSPVLGLPACRSANVQLMHTMDRISTRTSYLTTSPKLDVFLFHLDYLHCLDSRLGVFVKDVDHSLLELPSGNLLHEKLVQLCWTPVLGFRESEVGPKSAEKGTSGPEESSSTSPCFVSSGYEF